MKTSPLKALEHGFKKLVFFLSCSFFRKARSDFKIIDPLSIKRVLFIRPEKLGDMIISLPVFHNLKKLYPHLEIYTICSPRNISIIQDNDRLTGNFLYTKHFLRDLAMVKKIRRLKIDAVVDMICDDSVTSLFLTQLSSPRAWRIGVGKHRHRRYYDFNYRSRSGRGLGTGDGDGSGPVRLNRADDGHVIDTTLQLLRAFGIDTTDLPRQIPPVIAPACWEKAKSFFRSLDKNGSDGLATEAIIIGLNISAGRPSRVWPDSKNRELLELLLNGYGNCRIVISFDPRERDRGEELAREFDSRVVPLPQGLNLLEVSAIISKMRILITPDTSLVHIARSFDVPVVGLYTRFGRNFELWKPYNQENGTVISGNDYNIFDIETSDVYEAVTGIAPPDEI